MNLHHCHKHYVALCRSSRPSAKRKDNDSSSGSKIALKAWLEHNSWLLRCLKAQTNGFNDVTATLNGIVHANIIAIVVMYVYGALRTEGFVAVLSAYFGSVTFIAYCMLTRSYGEINEVSKTLIRAAKVEASVLRLAGERASSKFVQLEMKSMRELRIMAGSTFYYDKALVLTVIAIIISQSVNLLILK